MSTSAAAVAGVRRHKEAARKRNQKRESPNGHRDRGVAALRDDLTGATEKVREELSAKMDGADEIYFGPMMSVVTCTRSQTLQVSISDF